MVPIRFPLVPWYSYIGNVITENRKKKWKIGIQTRRDVSCIHEDHCGIQKLGYKVGLK